MTIILIILQVFLLFRLFFKYNKSEAIVLFISLFVLWGFVLKNDFDAELIHPSGLWLDTILKRHETLSAGLGLLYRNYLGITFFSKVEPSFFRFIQNSFVFMDISLFMSLNNIFTFVILVLQIIGFYRLFIITNKTLLYYFIIVFVLSGFIVARSFSQMMLFYPFYYFLTLLGLDLFYKLIYEKKANKI